MANKKQTRRALISSIVSLMLCVSMLVGTTFAWFTDEVTSGVNKIAAGNLDVELTNDDGEVKNDTVLFDDVTLWEPGAVAYENLTVANVGTLTLKYQLAINFTNENYVEVDGVQYKLSDVLKVAKIDKIAEDAEREDVLKAAVESGNAVTLDTFVESGSLDPQTETEIDSDTYGLVIFWEPGDVDNNWNVNNGKKVSDYVEGKDNNYLHIDLGVTLFATQEVAESDSFGPEYDAGAWHELGQDENGAYLLYTAGDLMAFNAMLDEVATGEGRGISAKLMADVDMAGYDWKSIEKMWITFDGNGHTISNLNCIENNRGAGFFSYMGGCTIKNLTLENVTASGSQAGIFAGQTEGGKLINCNVAGNNVIAWTDDSGDKGTGNGIGIYTGVSDDASVISGTILKDASVVLIDNGLTPDNAWEETNIYAGGLYYGIAPDVSGVVDENAGGAETPVVAVADGLYKDEAKNYYVSSPSGLSTLNANLAEQEYDVTTITLLSDIDFDGYEWAPVDLHADRTFKSLSLINGNGHTISNLTVNGQAMFTRFAGNADMVTIRDLTFDNATIDSSKLNTSILTVQTYQNVTLDNVDVVDSSISGSYKVAPLIATVYNEGSSTVTATLKNCDVINTTVTATVYDFCTTGLVAYVRASDNDKVAFENCTVQDVTLVVPANSGYNAHAFVYTTGSESLYNEAEGVTVTNCQVVTEITGESGPVTVEGGVTVVLKDATIVATADGASALTVKGNSTVVIEGDVTLKGATNGSGIYVAEGAVLNLTGDGNLVAISNAGEDNDKNQSGTGGIYGAADSVININGLTSLRAEGYGERGFGIGGKTTSITITDTTVTYAKGGYVKADITDKNYGKGEPEGAPAIGSEVDGAVISIIDSTVVKAEGGSKAAGIGARYHTGVTVNITGSDVTALGGNSSAGIGGSRVEKNANVETEAVSITIIKSTINATGGDFGAGIGSGYDTYCQGKEDAAKAPATTVTIDAESVITAQGGLLGAGIGTGHNVVNFVGNINCDTTNVNAGSSEDPDWCCWGMPCTEAQAIGLGVLNTNHFKAYAN